MADVLMPLVVSVFFLLYEEFWKSNLSIEKCVLAIVKTVNGFRFFLLWLVIDKPGSSINLYSLMDCVLVLA